MLDPKYVRSQPETVAAALAVKGFTLDVEKLNQLGALRRDLLEKAQSLQAERNAYAKIMGKAIAEAKARGEDIAPLKAKGESLKIAALKADDALDAVQEQLDVGSLTLKQPPRLPVLGSPLCAGILPGYIAH